MLTTGCNKTVFDTQYTFDKAIMYNDNNALIVDISSWCDYDGEQVQIKTGDTVILSSTFNTIFVDEDQGISANDIAVTLVGEDGCVYYYNSETKEKELVNKK